MRKHIFLLIICSCCLNINAQNDNDDYHAFRKRMLSNYQGFRKNILDDYAKFLNGIWEDYEVLAGRKLRPQPKPVVQPQKKDNEPAPPPATIVPEEVRPTEPVVEDKPKAPQPVPVAPTDLVSFEWCGMLMQLPDAKIRENLNDISKQGLIDYLEIMNNSLLGNEVTAQIANITNSCNLNDWCLYMLVESYVKKIKANANNNTKNLISWYLMVQQGYDIRLAFNGNNLFLMIPFAQQIYSRSYITINNTHYYIYGEGTLDEKSGISTPNIPEDAGKILNVIITRPLQIPYKAKNFTHTFAGRTLSVDVNENLIKVMAKFPQMPIPAYAVSSGDNKFRKQILSQMKQFIQNMSELEAANFILQFIQSFKYATDDEQFGYEKPFFIEETLYYPKCDCEDRSILYHFLITQLLGNDVHLVHYPNHECTAVNFSQELNADSYIYKNRQYVICDPTYIGATIGMCMPDFKSVKPEIDLIK